MSCHADVTIREEVDDVLARWGGLVIGFLLLAADVGSWAEPPRLSVFTAKR
jgi:hypothetical protein